MAKNRKNRNLWYPKAWNLNSFKFIAHVKMAKYKTAFILCQQQMKSLEFTAAFLVSPIFNNINNLKILWNFKIIFYEVSLPKFKKIFFLKK